MRVRLREEGVVSRQVRGPQVVREGLFIEDNNSNLSRTRDVHDAFPAVFACFVIFSEVGIARLLWDRLNNRRRRRRSPSGLARVDAGSSLTLSDEGSGALVGDDLEVVRATGV